MISMFMLKHAYRLYDEQTWERWGSILVFPVRFARPGIRPRLSCGLLAFQLIHLLADDPFVVLLGHTRLR
jgi:hypothetical protein